MLKTETEGEQDRGRQGWEGEAEKEGASQRQRDRGNRKTERAAEQARQSQAGKDRYRRGGQRQRERLRQSSKRRWTEGKHEQVYSRESRHGRESESNGSRECAHSSKQACGRESTPAVESVHVGHRERQRAVKNESVWQGDKERGRQRQTDKTK